MKITIDSYYSDITQTYIGTTAEEIDNIQYETEQHMKGSHFSLSSIYETEWLYDETDPESNKIIKSYNESQEWLNNFNKLMKYESNN